MKTNCRKFVMSLLLVPVLGWAQGDAEQQNTADPDYVVTAQQVPERVMATAKATRPSGYFVRITRRLGRDDQFYYVFDVSQVGKFWIMKVRSDGSLIELNEAAGPPSLSSDD